MTGTPFPDSSINAGNQQDRSAKQRKEEARGVLEGVDLEALYMSTTPMSNDRDNQGKPNTLFSPKIINDAVLGLSDGLTVPFALTAGLTAFGNAKLVVLGGLAELIAGAISMGLGGFVGAKSEVEHYQATERKCTALIQSSPYRTAQIVQDHFRGFGMDDGSSAAVCQTIHASPDTLREFLMRNHFDEAEPPDSRPWISALTLAVAYFSGGFIPLIPYFAVAKNEVLTGLWWSIGVMAIVLLIFGYVKTGIVRGWRGQANVVASVRGAIQMLIVGAAAAGAAVGLVRAINRGTQQVG